MRVPNCRGSVKRHCVDWRKKHAKSGHPLQPKLSHTLMEKCEKSTEIVMAAKASARAASLGELAALLQHVYHAAVW